jgi:hypothetical protein
MYYMHIDAPFCEWWNTCFPTQPLLPGQAIPILKNLQGHPKAPRQWFSHIDKILVRKLALTSTTHAPCLYRGTVAGKSILFLCQVDDFSIACTHHGICDHICKLLDEELAVHITRHGPFSHISMTLMLFKPVLTSLSQSNAISIRSLNLMVGTI